MSGSRPSHRVLLPLMLLPILALSCSGDGSGPVEGYWRGDHLIFQYKGGVVFELGTLGVSCQGDDSCFAENNQFFAGTELTVKSMSFSGVLSNLAGTVAIEGSFINSTHAEGTYTFTSANGCCTVSGKWRADLLEPYPEPVDDTWEGDGALRQDGSESDASPSQPCLPKSSPEQYLACQHTNKIRESLDIPLLYQDPAIDKAAQSHATYFEFHCSKYQKSSLSPHNQNPDWKEGFTGTQFYERMTAAGVADAPGWEVMAFVGNPVEAVDEWMATLYHRIPFVHPATLKMGYGMEKGGCFAWSSGTDVMDFSRKYSASSGEPVFYPFDGQTGVPPSWLGNESPQPPLPPKQSYPSGPIITVTFPSWGGFAVEEHLLFSPEGDQIPHQYLDPSNDPAKFLSDTVAIYAYDPLKPNSTYTVRLSGKWKNEKKAWQWSFSTGK